jgi:septal ring factor EnvC (AmiA/AmiB activator)
LIKEVYYVAKRCQSNTSPTRKPTFGTAGTLRFAYAVIKKRGRAELELKAKWREEIRAEISEEFSSELGRRERKCTELSTRLTAANEEIAELRTRLAELESQIKPPGGRML